MHSGLKPTSSKPNLIGKESSSSTVSSTGVQRVPDKRRTAKEGANKQVISSQADSLIKISRIWADFFPANTSNQPI